MKTLKRSKECPSCKKKHGPRKLQCDCGHQFGNAKKTIKNGKRCPQCTTELKPRAKECTACSYKYPEKSKKGYEEIKDWRKLKEGQQVILRKGSRGPYYLSPEKGKILMGYRGTYIVKRIQDDGIVAYSTAGGFAFLYMGPNRLCEITGLQKRRYKLFKRV